MIRGFVDVVSTRHVEGWAVGPNGETPLLHVLVDGALVASVVPNIRRPDLDFIVPNAIHGFRVDFPRNVAWPAIIEVIDKEGDHLSKSPAQLSEPDNSWLDSAPNARSFLSYYFLKGEGIEIGALDRPLPVAPNVIVRYVDRMDAADLTSEYPEINSSMVKVDIIADGQTLTGLEDGRYDFVIANHVIEHMEDPTLTIKNFLRVLRPGGTIFMAVPDKRKTFDFRRSLTSIRHLLDDHNNGPSSSRDAHYQEWVDLVEGKVGDKPRAHQLKHDGYSIHFHTWDCFTLPAYLEAITSSYKLPLDVKIIYPVDIEIITILQKLA